MPAGQMAHAQNQRLRHQESGSDAYAPAPLEKLATASASVLKTSKTVSSLVIWRTSWNLLPRWQRRKEAPCIFTLWCAATSVPSPALSIKVMLSILRIIFFFPSAIKLFTFSRKALLSSPSTMRPSSATTDTPSTSRFVIFKATLFSSSSESGSGGNPVQRPKPHQNMDDPGAKNRNRRPGSGQITGRLIVVRAGHVVAAHGTDQLAAPRLQPLRADGTIARRICGTRDGARTALQRRRGLSCGLCQLGLDRG